MAEISPPLPPSFRRVFAHFTLSVRVPTLFICIALISLKRSTVLRCHIFGFCFSFAFLPFGLIVSRELHNASSSSNRFRVLLCGCLCAHVFLSPVSFSIRFAMCVIYRAVHYFTLIFHIIFIARDVCACALALALAFETLL